MKQYTLLTASGINKLLKTASDGSKIALKEVVVSDYDGELSEQTASIPNEKYRGDINAITIDESDSNILDVDAIIPPEVGGFYIKTAGIYCDDGSLFAVARLADTYKPLLNEGSSKDITLNFKLQIANASESIILKVDNNIVLATRKWCEKMFLKLKDKIDAYTKKESDDKFALKTELTDGLPIGAYLSYPSQKTIPAGFLIADGRSLKKAEYTELFDVLGYVYGGSGENFNLPNFADGKFMRSIGGNAAGLGVVQQDAFQGHFHKWKDSTTEVGWTYNFTGNTSNKPGTRDNISSIAEPKSDGVNGEPRTANETRPYNMAVVVIIKAKNVNTPTAGQIDKTILATEAKLGVVKLKNSITAKQEDAAITEKAVSDAIEANKSIGIGQTYQDVWAQRELNTYYLNTTSRPIMVGVDFEPTLVDTPISVVIDDQIVRTAGIDSRIHVGFSFVVPAGSKYKIATLLNTSLKKINLVVDVTNKKYNTWNELK
nr:phage tail protein [Campylobacter concisus]